MSFKIFEHMFYNSEINHFFPKHKKSEDILKDHIFIKTGISRKIVWSQEVIRRTYYAKNTFAF